MADNTQLPSTGTGTADIKPATRKVTYSGDAGVDMQVVGLAVLTGSDDAKTPTDVTAAAPLPVAAVGDVAHDAADTGNPVKIGSQAQDFEDIGSTPNVGFGDRVNLLLGLKGQLAVTLMSSGGAFDQPIPVTSTPVPPLVGETLTNVAASVTSVTLQASNTARRGLTIWNDSTSVLYVKFGATASATSCTVKLVADAYYEVPFGYIGRVDGIWVSATGTARMTEIE